MPQLDPVLISGNEGIEKPAAEIFLKACERAGVLPEQALHIGDELVWCVFSLQGLYAECERELTFDVHTVVTTMERKTQVCVLYFCGDLVLKVKKLTKRRART